MLEVRISLTCMALWYNLCAFAVHFPGQNVKVDYAAIVEILLDQLRDRKRLF